MLASGWKETEESEVQNYFFTKGFKKYDEFKNGIKKFINAFS